jgi:hypothetical protein
VAKFRERRLPRGSALAAPIERTVSQGLCGAGAAINGKRKSSFRQPFPQDKLGERGYIFARAGR